jgi:hypothetical protein
MPWEADGVRLSCIGGVPLGCRTALGTANGGVDEINGGEYDIGATA